MRAHSRGRRTRPQPAEGSMRARVRSPGPAEEAARRRRARVLEDAGPWHDQVFARFYPMNAASRLAAVA